MIKVTVGESKTQSEKPFPKLMVSSQTGNVVFFLSSGEGVVLLATENGSNFSSGEYFSMFDMKCFTDYNEPITLQNV